MAKSEGKVHHVLRADIHTLDLTSLVNTKKLINELEKFDAILVLIERIFFSRMGCPGPRFD